MVNPGFWHASPIYYIIPIISLSTLPIARVYRAVRSEIIDALSEDYILLARMKGFNHAQIIFRHILRNIIIPVIPVTFNAFFIVLNWSFLVEIVYRVPGIAVLLYDSLISANDITTFISFDVYMVTLVAGFYGLIALLAGLVMDVTNVMVDPRIKLTKTRRA